jgi:hypothetical protein
VCDRLPVEAVISELNISLTRARSCCSPLRDSTSERAALETKLAVGSRKPRATGAVWRPGGTCSYLKLAVNPVTQFDHQT